MALVYMRRSSPQQVREHRESGALQYDLVRLAEDLGWPPTRVEVIDDDQGRGAESVEGRLGFQRLLAEVGPDHVGIIVGIDLVRLARSCKDWHQLLDYVRSSGPSWRIGTGSMIPPTTTIGCSRG
jgi:DNA invertase Pin-like site-specific DNA recombinase